MGELEDSVLDETARGSDRQSAGACNVRMPQVYLVGTGPGPPDLVTLRAVRCLERADLVLYDRLVHPALLERVPASAERLVVGDCAADHKRTQEEINGLLVTRAQQGQIIVHLQGGDPFVFGRGGEEALALSRAGIPFAVVPGVLAGHAVPACAGIPVTLGGVADQVTFVTSREHVKGTVDWRALAALGGTLVVLMAVNDFSLISRELQAGGRAADTPVAVIHRGAEPAQRTVEGTLADIGERVETAGLRPPAVLVVGEVVALRDQLQWFEHRPLFGRRVVVTRPRAQAGPLVEALCDLGAEVVPFPIIRTEPVYSSPAIAGMIGELESYDFLIFTSANGVDCFFGLLEQAGKDARCLSRALVVTIGPQTAAACRRWGLLPDLVPAHFVAEGVLEALVDRPLAGKRVLIPRAREAREVLPQTLVARGAQVDVVPVYDTVPEDYNPAMLSAVMGADYVTFTSSSTVRHFVALLLREALGSALSSVKAASIGPVTSGAVHESGMELVVEAEEYTAEGLLEALVRHAAGTTGGIHAPGILPRLVSASHSGAALPPVPRLEA